MKRKNGQASNAVTAIAACITSPDKAGPVRYRDALTGTKTATVNLQTMPQADWPDVTPPGQRILGSNYFVALFRDMLRWYIQDLKSGVSLPTTYIWHFDGLTTPTPTTPIYVGTTQLPTSYAQFSAGTAYHGQRLYHGQSQGKRFLWQDNSYVSVVLQGNLTATQTLTMTLYTWNEGAPLPLTSLTFPPLSVSGTALSFASFPYQYVALEANLEDTSVTPVALNITATTTTIANTECFAHRCVPQLESNQGRVGSARVLGSACRLMNVSPPQYKAGSWVAIQLTKGDRWTNYIPVLGDPYTLLTTLKGVHPKLLEKGCYGYHKPTQAEDFDFRIPFENVYNTTQSVNGYSLDDSTCVLFALFAPAGAGTLSHAFQLQFSTNIEYATDDQWTATQIAETESDDWENALEVVSSMEQFYENPTHWAEIFRTIGKFARVGAPIVSLFGPYGRAAGAGMSVIGSALGQI